MKHIRPSMSGIYQILNTRSGEKYVGSSTRIYDRLKSHLSFLANGTHINKRLQNAWKQDSPTSFQFSVLEIVADPLLLPQREIYWIRHTGAQNLGFNTKTDLHKEHTSAKVGSDTKKEMENLKMGSMNTTLETLLRFYQQHSNPRLKEAHTKFHDKES